METLHLSESTKEYNFEDLLLSAKANELYIVFEQVCNHTKSSLVEAYSKDDALGTYSEEDMNNENLEYLSGVRRCKKKDLIENDIYGVQKD